MSLLNLYGRQYTVFDPHNIEHRQFYYQFVKSGTWARCPYRFVIPDEQGDLITMIQRALVKFYSEAEFDRVAKKPRKKKPAS